MTSIASAQISSVKKLTPAPCRKQNAMNIHGFGMRHTVITSVAATESISP